MDEHSISVVIVAYNEATDLQACLDSIKAHEPELPPANIVVVDHSTTSAVGQMIKLVHPDVTYRKNPNTGFGAGNNRGIRESDSNLVLFLNPDTRLTAPILGKALAQFQADVTLGALGIRIVTPKGKPQQSFFWIDGGGLIRGVTQHLLNRANIYIPSKMCTTGAALFVRRTAFHDAGEFDERIFLYCEETDLAKRLKTRGWRWRFRSDLQVVHIGGGTLPNRPFAVAERLKSLQHYCQKYDVSYVARLRKELRYIRVANAAKRILAPRRLGTSGDQQAIVSLYESTLARERARARYL